MASSSNPGKRIKLTISAGLFVDETGHFEIWFVGLDRSKPIEKYLQDYIRKAINTPKYLRVEWLKTEQPIEVSQMLELQGLEKFLGLIGNIYPDLVKVFFTNLKVKEDRLLPQRSSRIRVKGVTMKITPSIYMEVTGIKCEGLKVGKGNITALENFNKVHFFRSCLRNPCATMKGFHVGGLSINM